MLFDSSISTSLRGDLERTKNIISEITRPAAAHTELCETVDCALEASGKMLRPAFLFLCAGPGLTADVRDHLAAAAAAVEIVHTASLVHDDIVDDSPTRRGVPSVQSRFGKCSAVYTGDYLLSRALGYLIGKNYACDAALLAECVGRMCDGELIQLSNRGNMSVTEADCLLAASGKTAALFETACRLGGQMAGRSRSETDALTAFGHALGMLFQLRDDLLDWISTEHASGKPVNEDFFGGIFTLPAIYTFASPGYGEKLRSVFIDARENGGDTGLSDKARLTVIEAGGVDYGISKVREYGRAAIAQLSSLPDNQYKAAMISTVDKLCSGLECKKINNAR